MFFLFSNIKKLQVLYTNLSLIKRTKRKGDLYIYICIDYETCLIKKCKNGFISTKSDTGLVYLLGLTFFVIVFLFINPNFLILFTESLGVFLFSSMC